MRKEGVLFLLIGSALVLFGANSNYYELLNAFNLFLFAGVVPLINLSLPDNVMLAASLAVLVLLMTWPFRDSLRQKLEQSRKSLKHLRPKRRTPKTT